MNSLEALDELKNELFGYCRSSHLVNNNTKLEKVLKIYETFYHQIEKDLIILDILKNRIHLKDSKLKNAHFTIDEKGLPIVENDLKEVDAAFIEASGFVFKDSNDYKLLKEWLDNDK